MPGQTERISGSGGMAGRDNQNYTEDRREGTEGHRERKLPQVPDRSFGAPGMDLVGGKVFQGLTQGSPKVDPRFIKATFNLAVRLNAQGSLPLGYRFRLKRAVCLNPFAKVQRGFFHKSLKIKLLVLNLCQS